ncbi:hypothetical protein [Sphingobacterium sp. BIGb0165]|uniref:hypothetical protein n=1 Tax=Sphingobacterium sp. BIGb0165 TaxID=2940615 RepID=UPI002169FF36|nr:hypothetical protein [Sphingobacterium sp. BIGb0165]MCS4227142.1 hypothetical protein [Sphingobacterium sp. BIGb0165]
MIWLFFIFQFGLFILATIIALDLACIAIFLFYQKDKTRLLRNTIIKSPLGGSLLSLKTMAFACLIIPTLCLLYFSLLGKFANINLSFILAYYSTAIISFLLLVLSSKIHQKIQISSSSIGKIKLLFIIEICILITLLFFATKVDTMSLL